jgi:hypothetical protein
VAVDQVQLVEMELARLVALVEQELLTAFLVHL